MREKARRIEGDAAHLGDLRETLGKYAAFLIYVEILRQRAHCDRFALCCPSGRTSSGSKEGIERALVERAHVSKSPTRPAVLT